MSSLSDFNEAGFVNAINIFFRNNFPKRFPEEDTADRMRQKIESQTTSWEQLLDAQIQTFIVINRNSTDNSVSPEYNKYLLPRIYNLILSEYFSVASLLKSQSQNLEDLPWGKILKIILKIDGNFCITQENLDLIRKKLVANELAGLDEGIFILKNFFQSTKDAQLKKSLREIVLLSLVDSKKEFRDIII